MDSFQQHYGHWVLAAFMIVIASWIFYRYLAPRTWARRDEKEMLATFGDQYRVYQRNVPMFLPRWGEWARFFKGRNKLESKQSA